MNDIKSHAEHIANKHVLWSLIKQVGEFYGEEIELLAEYARDVYQSSKDELPTAIVCFRLLIEQTKAIKTKKVELGHGGLETA